jgi:hypothetical protein
MKWFLGIAIAILAGIAGVMICVYLASMTQAKRVDRATFQLKQEFPRGLSFDAALAKVERSYPRHTTDSTESCAANVRITTPRYQSHGGPCIFGFVDVPTTWWGFEAAVTFRLLFEADGSLGELQVFPVHTFL